MRRMIWVAAIIGIVVAAFAATWLSSWARQDELASRRGAPVAPAWGGATPNAVAKPPSPTGNLTLPPPLTGVPYSHDAPAYDLPLVINIDAPPAPERIRGSFKEPLAPPADKAKKP